MLFRSYHTVPGSQEIEFETEYGQGKTRSSPVGYEHGDVYKRQIFKIKYEYVILSMVGCIVDGPTSSLTAAGADWKSLINVGLIMGVIAGACGNYVGIFVSYVVKGICGL